MFCYLVRYSIRFPLSVPNNNQINQIFYCHQTIYIAYNNRSYAATNTYGILILALSTTFFVKEDLVTTFLPFVSLILLTIQNEEAKLRVLFSV